MANVLGIIQQPKRHNWETPQDFFDTLNEEFDFTVDVAADESNHKTPCWYGPGGLALDGLSQLWGGETVWCNPPYGTHIAKWVEKAHRDSRFNHATVVMLIPARTETAYWHDHVMRAAEIRFVRGRLRFSGYTVNAPFPSAVVVFRPYWFGEPTVSTIGRLGK